MNILLVIFNRVINNLALFKTSLTQDEFTVRNFCTCLASDMFVSAPLILEKNLKNVIKTFFYGSFFSIPIFFAFPFHSQQKFIVRLISRRLKMLLQNYNRSYDHYAKNNTIYLTSSIRIRLKIEL